MIRIHFLCQRRPRERNEGEEGMTFLDFFLFNFVRLLLMDKKRWRLTNEQGTFFSLSADYRFLLSLNNHALR